MGCGIQWCVKCISGSDGCLCCQVHNKTFRQTQIDITKPHTQGIVPAE